MPESVCELAFMWYKNLGGTFVRFVTIHAVTDRQTDRRTLLPWEGPRCIQCSAVKIGRRPLNGLADHERSNTHHEAQLKYIAYIQNEDVRARLQEQYRLANEQATVAPTQDDGIDPVSCSTGFGYSRVRI